MAADWAVVDATKNSSTTVTFNANGAAIGQYPTTVEGVRYTLTFKARRITGNTSLLLYHYNSATGGNDPLVLTGALTSYSYSFLGKLGGGGVSVGIADGNISGFGQIELTDVHMYVNHLGSATPESIRWTRGINGVTGTLDFTLILPYGAPAVDVGDTVALTSSEGVEFSGYIARVNPTITYEDNNTSVRWAYSCQDETRLLDNISVGIETFDGQSDKWIIQYLMAKYLSTVTTTNVSIIVAEMPALDLTGKTLRQCKEAIAAFTLGIWYVEPGAALWYHASTARKAPFSIAETFDSISTEGARVESFSMTKEFSSPCNSAEVRNIPNEEVLAAVYAPPATGDDGQTSLTSGAYPPTGTATPDTDNATIRAERTRVNNASPEAHNYTPTTGAGGSDAILTCTGTGWPPDTGSLALAQGWIGGELYVAAVKSGSTYIYIRSILGFDTSAIPNDAEVISVSLTLKTCLAVADDVGGVIHAGWMNKASAEVELADWDDPSRMIDGYRSAIGDTEYSGFSGTQVFALGNAALGVQNTKYSWLWMSLETGSGIPTGVNYLRFDASESGSNSPILSVTYRQAGTNYAVACAFVRFDTSGLPDDAEIVSANLALCPAAAPVNADGGSVGVEYYASANWPIGAGDHTNTPSQAASSYQPLSGIVNGEYVLFPLTDPDTNISKTGYTGFRVHAYTAATPTGENSVEFISKDAGGDLPELRLSYITGGSIVGNADNLPSQTLYGLFKRTVVNSGLKSEEEATLQAEALVAVGAWPQQAITAKIERPGLAPGQWVQVNFPALDINEGFLIRSLSVGLEGETPVYSVEVGDFRPDLIQFLRLQAAK